MVLKRLAMVLVLSSAAKMPPMFRDHRVRGGGKLCCVHGVGVSLILMGKDILRITKPRRLRAPVALGTKED